MEMITKFMELFVRLVVAVEKTGEALISLTNAAKSRTQDPINQDSTVRFKDDPVSSSPEEKQETTVETPGAPAPEKAPAGGFNFVEPTDKKENDIRRKVAHSTLDAMGAVYKKRLGLENLEILVHYHNKLQAMGVSYPLDSTPEALQAMALDLEKNPPASPVETNQAPSGPAPGTEQPAQDPDTVPPGAFNQAPTPRTLVFSNSPELTRDALLAELVKLTAKFGQAEGVKKAQSLFSEHAGVWILDQVPPEKYGAIALAIGEELKK